MPISKEQAAACLKLADYLDELPPRQYYHKDLVRTVDPECGTVACAFGHAVASGLFPELGLKVFYAYGSYSLQTTDGDLLSWSLTEIADSVFGENSWGRIFEAYAYGITPAPSVTAEMVAARLRKFALVDNVK